MEFWKNIYTHFDPVAFSLFGVDVHWYGIMYVLALFTALWMAQYLVKRDKIAVSKDELDSFFIWVEIGVILGARIGYFIFYVPDNLYYFTHPWEMFNPYHNGNFVGISGMSYHGAIIGFLIATLLFTYTKKVNFWRLMDLVSIAVPAGYTFGRIGNFLNKELYGRETDQPWGIFVDGAVRHPSQLYEAFLEGILIFVIIYFYRNYKRFEGELIALYMILYGIARSTAEIFRQPDPQLGFIIGQWTMGQILSTVMIIGGLIIYGHYFVRKKQKV